MINLDPKYPILFFPIRIETKYYGNEGQPKKLKIRFFPDQISINNFDPRLTDAEYDDAKMYWEEIKSIIGDSEFEEKQQEAWQKIVDKYDVYRASYITKKVIDYNPDDDPDPLEPAIKPKEGFELREEDDYKPANYKILPKKFYIYGKFNNESLPPLSTSVSEQTEPLGLKVSPLSIVSKGFLSKSSSSDNISGFEDEPLPEDPYEIIDPDLKWISSFEEAKQKGMAAEIDLTQDQYESGFEVLLAYGVRDNQQPEEAKNMVEELFNAHHYSESLSFLNPDTPTNLVEGLTQEFSSAEPDAIDYREIEFSSVVQSIQRNSTIFDPDGKFFERIIGIRNVAQGVKNANQKNQANSMRMANLLWSAVMGNFIEQILLKNTKEFAEILTLSKLKEHFINNVAPQGIVFRVGKTPYGILPVTIPSMWVDSEEIIKDPDYFKNLLLLLKEKWLEFSNDVPTIMNCPSDVSAGENLINILSMNDHSHTYYVRGFRDIRYIYAYSCYLGFPGNLTDFQDFYKQLVDTRWDEIFSDAVEQLDKYNLRDWSYNLIIGGGIEELQYPIVNDSDIQIISQKIDDFFAGNINSFDSETTSLLFKLLEFSAKYLKKYGTDTEKEHFKEDLAALTSLNPDVLKSLMLRIMDKTAFRLDAWLTSLAYQKLEHLRSLDNYNTGLYVGTFGWVENLKPKQTHSAQEGGFIHSYTLAQAKAFAVIRDGYLTHSDCLDKKNLLKVNLGSERVRNALETVQAIQNIPLAEYLGMKLERNLHDAGHDYLIDEFRKHFPLQNDDLPELVDLTDPSKERVVPRSITDGLKVYENWKRLKKSLNESTIDHFMENDEIWKLFYIDIQKYPGCIDYIQPHLNYIFNIVDGLTDLSLFEAIYQSVNLNFDRAAAVLDGMDAYGPLPQPESPLIPMSGPRITRRIILPIKVDAINARDPSLYPKLNEEPREINPRKIAEPVLNNLLNDYHGDIKFWLYSIDDVNNQTPVDFNPISLGDLRLEPIDLIYMNESELRNRLIYYGKTLDPTIDKLDVGEFKKPSPDMIDEKSYLELRFMIKSLKEIIGQGQPLSYHHLLPPLESDEEYDASDDFLELFQRYYNVLHLLHKTLEELNGAKADHDIQRKQEILLRASLFNLPSAIPITTEGIILTTESSLNERIDLVKKELEAEEAYTFNNHQYGNYTEELDFYLDTISNQDFNDLISEPSAKMEKFINRMKALLKNDNFLVLPHFSPAVELLSNLKTSDEINKIAHKWFQKNAYVKPRLKLFDKVIDFNLIFRTSNFTFYYDDETFFSSSSELLNSGEDNPLSILAVISYKPHTTQPLFPFERLTGLVLDEFIEKVIHTEQGTAVTFHHNSPNAEAPQCLLLGVSPDDMEQWTEGLIRDVILEALEIAKIRLVDYRSLKQLMFFLPLNLLGLYGSLINARLFRWNL